MRLWVAVASISAVAAILIYLSSQSMGRNDDVPGAPLPELQSISRTSPVPVLTPVPASARISPTRVKQQYLGNVSTAGDIDPAVIRRTMQSLMPSARQCLDDRLKTAPDFHTAAIEVTFKIAPNGNVVDASATGDPALVSCVVAAVQGSAFPKPRDSWIEVSHWFIFDA